MEKWHGYFILILGLCGMGIALTGCGDNGGGVDPEPTKYTITVSAKEDGQTLSGVTFSVSGNIIGADTESITLTRTKGTKLTVRAEKDGYAENSIALTFNRNKSETIALQKNDPDKAMVKYRIKNENNRQINDAQLFIADTLAGDASGSIALPFSDSPVDLCGRADYHEENCRAVTPNRDYDISIELTAEMVDVAVNSVTDTKSGDPIDDATITVSGYTYETSETSHSFTASSGKRDVSVFAAGSDTLRQQITADESHQLSIELTMLPECSNGLNDDADNSTDAEDIGCVDEDGNYDPEDDVEKTITVSNSFSAGDSKQVVPNQDGDKRIPLLGTTFPREFKFAIGEIRFFLFEKQEKNEENEITTMDLYCKESTSNDYSNNNPYISDIIPDTGKDGWQELQVHGFTREIFHSEGLHCGAGLRSEGSGDVVIADEDHPRKIRYEADFEPEETPGWMDEYE